MPAAAAASGAVGQSWSSQPSAGQSGGTLTSHRREYGAAGPGEPGQPAGAPPAQGGSRGPRWYRQPRWIAALAAVVVLLAGLGTWAGLSGGSHGHAQAATTTSHTPKPTPVTGALMNAVMLANTSLHAKGMLPPSACKQHTPTYVTCTAPASSITGAVFQTYPTLTALYAAYQAKVASLNTGQFRQDFNDCGSQATYGEVGWNHLYQHTRKYTVAQMTMGMVTDDQAAGRVFCNFTQGLEYMVWTQDDGHVLGFVAGTPHENVWNWWVSVHHNIPLGGGGMNMNMNPSSSQTGNGTSPSSSMSMSPSPSSSMSMSPSSSMSSTGG